MDNPFLDDLSRRNAPTSNETTTSKIITLEREKKYDENFKVVLSQEELAKIPSNFYELNKDQIFDLYLNNKITQEQYVHITDVIDLRQTEQVKEEAKKKNLVFPLLDDKGRPIKCHENLEYLMNFHHINAMYNEMSREVDVNGTKYESLNHSITYIYSLAHKNYFKLTKTDVVDFIDVIGVENKYNPVHQYLENAMLHWDGVNRIQQLVDTLITSDEKINQELKYELVKTWLVSSARITKNTLYNPINTEGVLVLQGKQGVGKTTWIKHLIPTELIAYFKEGIQLNVDNKDSVYEATCNWICELGELDGTLKREQASLKAFFTKSIDVQRRPYAVKEEKYPRLTSFFGTVNDEEFLQDATGDRRYWVIPIEGIKLEELEAIDLKQLWGEVMNVLMKEHKAHDLKPHIKQMLNESNSNYRVTSKVQIKVQVHFDWNAPKEEWRFLESSEVANILDLKTTKGLKQAIEECGGTYKRNKKMRGYVIPPIKSVYNV